MENIVLHLKLVRGMKGTPLAYVVWHHIKVAHVSHGYGAYLNLDKEMIIRAHIVDAKSNLKMTQETWDRAYLSYQVNTFKIHNAMVYQIFSKVLTNMDAYVYVKQRKETLDSWAVYFHIHKHFLGIDHMVRQATDAEGKLQNSHYDGQQKTWDWDKYVALHKEQHAIMVSLTDYGYSGIDNGTKVGHFLQASRALSWRQRSVLSVPNLRSVEQTLMLPNLIWAKWSQRKAWLCNQSKLWKPEVSWWPLWGKSSVRNTPRQSGTPWLRSSRWRFASFMINKESSPLQSRLSQAQDCCSWGKAWDNFSTQEG